MSTRYVWGKYTTKTRSKYKTVSSTNSGSFVPTCDGDVSLSSDNPLYYAIYSLNTSTNTMNAVLRNRETGGQLSHGSRISVPPSGYVVFRDTPINESELMVGRYWCRKSTVYRENVITFIQKGGYWRLADADWIEGQDLAFLSPLTRYYRTSDGTETVRDSYISNVSGASQNSYPEDGVSGSYWYEYKGSDNIDPSACSIPASIMGGTAINITVTPGTGKVYGGTVSYIYQVSLAGGAWTTVATTAATSRSYTVPYGTASIQVRVRAQDNIGFTSSTYVTSSSVTVINNQPPTAPGSIDVTGVVAGRQATITLTAATDPDGTIASYIYERSVDGSAWQQIANVNSLTQTDTISADWGTVAYRACAVDDDGASGPYVTSGTTVVNSGWVIISGPAADMGSQPKPFDFVFSVSVTGQASVDSINAVVLLDGETIYTGTPNSDVEVPIPIDTRLLAAGEHTVEVQATKESYLEANASYTFNVPAIDLPDGGVAEMLQNPEGDVVFPYTLARLVIGQGGKDINELLAAGVKIQTGTYEGTGTYGQSNPNSLTFGFEPKLLIVHMVLGTTSGVARGPLIFMWPSVYSSLCLYSEFNGTGSSVTMYPIRASFSDNTVTWYSEKDADVQGNTSGLPISYTVFGQ